MHTRKKEGNTIIKFTTLCLITKLFTTLYLTLFPFRYFGHIRNDFRVPFYIRHNELKLFLNTETFNYLDPLLLSTIPVNIFITI